MEINFDHSPSFFKTMHGDLILEKLRIPSDFAKHISNDLADRATLMGPSGSCWRVTRRNSSKGSVYLHDGWQEFVRDHSLGDDEFLIFRYYGKMCFKVQIFNKTGLERTNVANFRQHQQSVLPKEKRPRGRPRKSKEEKDIRKQIETEAMGTPVPQMDVNRKNGSAKDWAKAETFTSKNPYFRVCISKSAVETARIQVIPVLFCRAYFPAHTFEVVLKNLKGEYWEVNSIFSMGKHSMCGGWTAFARDNNLKIGDVCIFELVAKYEMLVHIFSDQ